MNDEQTHSKASFPSLLVGWWQAQVINFKIELLTCQSFSEIGVVPLYPAAYNSQCRSSLVLVLPSGSCISFLSTFLRFTNFLLEIETRKHSAVWGSSWILISGFVRYENEGRCFTHTTKTFKCLLFCLLKRAPD